MIKAVIFDLDNTLIDFMHMKNEAIKAAINGMIESGLNISYEDARKKIFDIYDKEGYEYQEVLNEFIISEYKIINYKILAAGIVSYRRAKEEALIAYPNVAKTLIEISKLGLKLGLITDAHSREAWTRLYSTNLHHIFDKVLTYSDTKEYKPSKVPFQSILQHFKINSSEAIMVGDWPERDIDGAKSVGMKTAFARYGNLTMNEESIDSDIVLNDISEIIDYIKKINKV